MTRFGVLGDVHCEDVILAAALELFSRESVERVLCVGDLVDGLGDPVRTLELLQRVDCVAGNHDRWLLDNQLRDMLDATPPSAVEAHRAWLASLPPTRAYGDLLLCHGLGEDDMATLKPDDYGYGLENNDGVTKLLRSRFRYVVSGHSHQRMVRRLGDVTFINAGTLLRMQNPGVLVLDLGARTATFHDWNGSAFTAAASTAVP